MWRLGERGLADWRWARGRGLKFWATWCGPCLEECPHFVPLLEKYEGDDEVVFLTVATAGSSRDGVAQLLSNNGYTFPVLLDDEGQQAIDSRSPATRRPSTSTPTA